MRKQQLIGTAVMVCVSIALVFCIGALTKAKPVSYTPGTYYALSSGNSDGLWVKVVVTEDKIDEIEILENKETVGICEPALEQVPANIILYQTTAVSAVSGATKTSEGIKKGVEDALSQAQGKSEIVTYTPPAPKADPVPLNYKYNPGTYTATADGFEELVHATVVFNESSIVSVDFTSGDTPERVESVKAQVPADIVFWQTYEVDAASGATWTSTGLMNAVKACVEQAKAE